MAEEKTLAFVLVVVAIGAETEVIDEIKKINTVKEVFSTYGSWDLIIRIEVDNIKLLDKTITSIRKIPGVEYTETLVCSKV
ncbi:MAG: Lrp/AsnC ligand binding domain-containing protein [Candidatus Asgardarchaeia archaeon]